MRASALRSEALILLHIFSIGLSSGEQAGRNLTPPHHVQGQHDPGPLKSNFSADQLG